MYERSDAFVAMPGGVGTLEELVEQLTWAQLGHHSKPIILLNIDDYWRPLLTLFDGMRSEDFIRKGLHISLSTVDSADAVLPKIMEIAAERDTRAEEGAIPSKF
jgi:uncharacterized protein (TIGR00730 family)